MLFQKEPHKADVQDYNRLASSQDHVFADGRKQSGRCRVNSITSRIFQSLSLINTVDSELSCLTFLLFSPS